VPEPEVAFESEWDGAWIWHPNCGRDGAWFLDRPYLERGSLAPCRICGQQMKPPPELLAQFQ
jgi:hypothetical protein